MANNDTIFSTMLRAGKTTFFVDLKTSKSGSRFLSITESRLDSDNTKKRSTIRIFGESILELKKAIDEASAAM